MGRVITDSDVGLASVHEPDFEEAMRRYRRELHVYCYRMLGSFDDAEDHVQEVFLRAWRSPAPTPPAADQRRLLQAFIAAHEQADPEALIALLRDDVRLAISPQVGEFIGRAQVAAALGAGMTSRGAWRVLPTAANGRLAAAGYLRHPGETVFLPFVISVLDIQDGQLADIAAFEAADLIAAFGLPASR
jgi:RNA polymerase sigma-70 factor (ECF subfamily)